jgi:nitrogen fixation NifU-like protein
MRAPVFLRLLRCCVVNFLCLKALEHGLNGGDRSKQISVNLSPPFNPCSRFFLFFMYSPQVLEHLANPRNAGALDDATARGEAVNPVCGDLLRLYLKVADERISAASFEVEGCPPSIAAASMLTEMINDLTLAEARALTPADLTQALGGLPRHKAHCASLAIEALRAALAETEGQTQKSFV